MLIIKNTKSLTRLLANTLSRPSAQLLAVNNHLTKTTKPSFLISANKSTLSSSIAKEPLNLASLSCLQVNRSSIWTSSRVLLAAENKSGGQLSDELKTIMSKKFGEEEQKSAAAADLKEAKEKADEKLKLEEEKKTATGWGKYFTREHGWKISFLFFTGMFGGLGIYILIDWGAPRRDDNNNIVRKTSFSIFRF
jgi:hypothetical protein